MGKRSFDIILSLSCLLFFLPLLIVCCMVVRVTSPGPVLFLQERVGKDGVLFTIFKLRTLRAGSGGDRPYVVPGDCRITAFGKWLRRTKIDELPQLLNVFLGQMSLVGPRPLTAADTARVSRAVPGFARRLAVRPGLTGLAQLRTRAERRRRVPGYSLRLDLAYMRRQTFLLDVYILARTVSMALRAVEE